jgi:hypothetical protein
MPHQFTELTPTTLNGRNHIEVSLPLWEIDCCAPIPVVGELASWALTFSSRSAGSLEQFDRDRAWQVEHRGCSTWLLDGAVSAQWCVRNGPPPEPGRAVVRGSLVGTVHEAAPRVTGTVQRIRLATEYQRLAGPDTLESVPGTLTVFDVARAAKSLIFGDGREPFTPGREQLRTVAVLLDLTVP